MSAQMRPLYGKNVGGRWTLPQNTKQVKQRSNAGTRPQTTNPPKPLKRKKSAQEDNTVKEVDHAEEEKEMSGQIMAVCREFNVNTPEELEKLLETARKEDNVNGKQLTSSKENKPKSDMDSDLGNIKQRAAQKKDESKQASSSKKEIKEESKKSRNEEEKNKKETVEELKKQWEKEYESQKEEEIKKLKNDIKAKENKHKQEIEELKQYNSELEKEIQDLQQNNSRREVQEKNKKETVEELKKQWEKEYESQKEEEIKKLKNDIKAKENKQKQEIEELKQHNSRREVQEKNKKETVEELKKQWEKEYESQKEEEIKKLKNDIKAKEKDIKDFENKEPVRKRLKDENDLLKNRLSQLAGARLTEGNPAIADLSDPNRPISLGEKFSELYDNQWTDALEELLDDKKCDEQKAIDKLFRTVMDAYKFCEQRANDLHKKLKMVLESFDMKHNDLPQEVSKLIKDHRKALAVSLVEKLQEEYSKKQKAATNSKLGIYNQQCVRVCWFMTVQDPPVYLDESFSTGANFNKDLYKEYTKTGKKYDFVVWPVLYLHKGGALLSKGVAQGK